MTIQNSLVVGFLLVTIFLVMKVHAREERLLNTFDNTRQATLNQLNNNQNIALLSAHSAVTSSIGQVYGQTMDALAHRVFDKFIIPLRKFQESQHLASDSFSQKDHLQKDNEIKLPKSSEKLNGKSLPLESQQQQKSPEKNRESRQVGDKKEKDNFTPQNLECKKALAEITQKCLQ